MLWLKHTRKNTSRFKSVKEQTNKTNNNNKIIKFEEKGCEKGDAGCDSHTLPDRMDLSLCQDLFINV